MHTPASQWIVGSISGSDDRAVVIRFPPDISREELHANVLLAKAAPALLAACQKAVRDLIDGDYEWTIDDLEAEIAKATTKESET